MPSPLPYMQLWVKDWLASSGTRRLSLAGRGLYIDLALFQWEDGFIVDDVEELAAMVGVSEEEFSRVWPKVEKQFPVVAPGKRANERIATDREEAMAKVAKLKENGSKGGRPVKQPVSEIEPETKQKENQTETNVKANGFEMDNQTQTKLKAKPEPDPIPEESPPASQAPRRGAVRLDKPASVEDAIAYGADIGLPAEQCQAWWDHFSSNGWKISGRAPMKDWQASMRTWKRNWAGTIATRRTGHETPTVPVSGVDFILYCPPGFERAETYEKDKSGRFNAIRWFQSRGLEPTGSWITYCEQQQKYIDDQKGEAA